MLVVAAGLARVQGSEGAGGCQLRASCGECVGSASDVASEPCFWCYDTASCFSIQNPMNHPLNPEPLRKCSNFTFLEADCVCGHNTPPVPESARRRAEFERAVLGKPAPPAAAAWAAGGPGAGALGHAAVLAPHGLSTALAPSGLPPTGLAASDDGQTCGGCATVAHLGCVWANQTVNLSIWMSRNNSVNVTHDLVRPSAIAWSVGCRAGSPFSGPSTSQQNGSFEADSIILTVSLSTMPTEWFWGNCKLAGPLPVDALICLTCLLVLGLPACLVCACRPKLTSEVSARTPLHEPSVNLP